MNWMECLGQKSIGGCMTIQIDGVYVQCDACGESCAMSHTMICARPSEFKKVVLEYIKSGFEYYDLHGWKIIANRNSKLYKQTPGDVICGDCLRNLKKEMI